MAPGEEKFVGQGGSENNFLTSGLCCIVVSLPKMSKNSLDQTYALLYKRNIRPKFLFSSTIISITFNQGFAN